MNELAQKTEFLSWKIAPAPLNATQTAWFLGFEPHEIPMLVAAALLKPLGRPARNSTKFFATETLEQLRRNEKWLARASDAIASYWRRRNARKRNKDTNKREPINRSVPELDQIRKMLETE